MKFELTDLKIFLSALDGGSLTQAAAEHNLVVAAVSARIRRLESQFGISLFERTGRGIRPTLAGELFARHARAIVADAQQAESELDDFVRGRRGTVRMISNTNMLAEHMPQALGSFLAANPDINVFIEDRPSLEAVELLKSGAVHLAIVAALADRSGLESIRFVPDRLVLIAPQELVLPQQEDGAVAFSRILDRKLIGVREKAALTRFLHSRAQEMGRSLTFRIHLDGFEGVCQMVEAGAGIAIIPESAASRYAGSISVRSLQLADAWAERELYLSARSIQQLPAYARALFDHLAEYSASHTARQMDEPSHQRPQSSVT